MAAAWNSIILKKQFERLNPLLWTSCPLVWALPLITCDWSLARPQMAWSSWLIQISLSPGLYTKEVMFFVYVLWWKKTFSKIHQSARWQALFRKLFILCHMWNWCRHCATSLYYWTMFNNRDMMCDHKPPSSTSSPWGRLLSSLWLVHALPSLQEPHINPYSASYSPKMAASHPPIHTHLPPPQYPWP